MELVSIVLPVYNCEKTLSKAIESILLQNYSNFELIIVNDGSNDGSLDVIKSFKDNRIKLIHRALNRGLVYSLNEGINASSSDLVFRMDADDISLHNRLTCQLDFLKKINFEFSVVGTNYSVFINGIFDKIVRHPHSSYILPYYLIFDNYFCHPSVVLNKKLLNNSLTYNSNFNSEDYELFSRIIKLAPAYNINFEGIVYNSLESGRSKLFVDEIYNDRLLISLNYLNSYNSIFSIDDVSEIISKAVDDGISIMEALPGISLRIRDYYKMEIEKVVDINSTDVDLSETGVYMKDAVKTLSEDIPDDETIADTSLEIERNLMENVADMCENTICTMEELNSLASDFEGVEVDMAKKLSEALYRSVTTLTSDVKTILEEYKQKPLIDFLNKKVRI